MTGIAGPAVPADVPGKCPVNPGVVIGDDGLARPAWASVGSLLREYYDAEWGLPVTDEHGVLVSYLMIDFAHCGSK